MSDNFTKSSKFPANLRKETNILFFGETGVGKSTFLNGLVNYFSYGSLSEAAQKGPKFLIETRIKVTNPGSYREEDVGADANVGSRSTTANEKLDSFGASCTQKPRAYSFHVGEKVINIIDTPGIGDTRGMDYDAENAEAIMAHLANYKDLHAICILLKPDDSRATATFSFCINELLRQLHVSACPNIFFCFTHSRSTNYAPQNTAPLLRAHLDRLSQTRKVDIELKRNNMFYFDNEAVRYLCARNQLAQYENQYAESWDRSSAEMMRLLEVIGHTRTHSMSDTLAVHNTRQIILKFSRPLVEISENLADAQATIERQKKEIEALRVVGRSLQGNRYYNRTVTESKVVPKMPDTCPTCADRRRRGGGMLGTIFGRGGGGLEDRLPGGPGGGCWGGNYPVCGHRVNLVATTITEERTETCEDASVARSIGSNEGELKACERFLAELNAEATEKRAEQKQIEEACAEFAVYLNNNSILPYNDQYSQYVAVLVDQERKKPSRLQNKKLIDELESLARNYAVEVGQLNAKMNERNTKAISTEEINKLIVKIKQIKIFNKYLGAIEEIEIGSKKNADTFVKTDVQI